MSSLYPVNALLILGPTGSGKSPLGELIATRGFLGRRSHHLDFGSELRSISSGIGADSYSRSERDFILGVLESGLLLENEHFRLARKIIELFLERSRFRPGDALLLNGIPRHTGQARDIAAIANVQAVIVLNCSIDSIIIRIEENTGGDRLGRNDDTRQLVQKKLDIYRERTAPLVEHYAAGGCRIYHIDINERTSSGSAYHTLSSLAAADPPIAFVAEPPQR